MKIPNKDSVYRLLSISLARIVSEDSQPSSIVTGTPSKSSKDS